MPGALLLLAAISAVIVAIMTRIGKLDHPGARSSHTRATPKGGGIGIIAAFVIGMAFLMPPGAPLAPELGLIAAALVIAAVSFCDDLYNWSFAVKLAAQLAAALVAIGFGIRFQVLHLPVIGAVDTGFWGIPLTAAWIVFATNALNFIDGLNGLASGSVAIASLILAGFAWTQGDIFAQTACLVLAAGVAGFLPFNFPRARIFMGDVGSQFCGFISAALGILSSRYGGQSLSVLLMPMLLFAIYADVVFTLIRRALAGERLTEAHRGHLYQVAQRSGFPAAAVTLVYWGMTLWGGVVCVIFGLVQGPLKMAVPLLVVLLMALWLAAVVRMAKRGRLTHWWECPPLPWAWFSIPCRGWFSRGGGGPRWPTPCVRPWSSPTLPRS